MKRLGGIIDSMTPEERRNPKKTIDQSRRRRIAAGAGVEPHEVNELVKQFDTMADLMRNMSNMKMGDRLRMMKEMSKGGAFGPGGQIIAKKVGTGKRLSLKEKTKLKKDREKEKRRKQRDQRRGAK
jgi:signal recognition particle subunit SRP54